MFYGALTARQRSRHMHKCTALGCSFSMQELVGQTRHVAALEKTMQKQSFDLALKKKNEEIQTFRSELVSIANGTLANPAIRRERLCERRLNNDGITHAMQDHLLSELAELRRQPRTLAKLR